MPRAKNDILSVVVKFACLAPLILAAPLFAALGSTGVIMGLPFAYIFGAAPSALAGFVFWHLAIALKKTLEITQIGRLTAIILGALSGSIGSILGEFIARANLEAKYEYHWIVLYPSIISGIICGLICRRHLNKEKADFAASAFATTTNADVSIPSIAMPTLGESRSQLAAASWFPSRFGLWLGSPYWLVALPHSVIMKNTWSIFWRIAVLQSAIIIPIIEVVHQAGAANDLTILKWKPSILFAVVAISLVVFKRYVPMGALSLVWGSRLNASKYFWKVVQRVLVALYVTLAVANGLAALIFPLDTWLIYKTFGPLFALVLVSVFLGNQRELASRARAEE